MITPTKTYPIALCALLQISLLAGCVESGEKYANGTGGFPKDEAKSVELFTTAANQGDATGQDHLGIMLLEGRGTRKDVNKGLAWLLKAAKQGHAIAQFNLGVMYYRGQGVPRDYNKAFAWSKKAAEQGYVLAQRNLAIFYMDGYGTPKDLDKATEWLEKAAAQGDQAAKTALAKLHENTVITQNTPASSNKPNPARKTKKPTLVAVKKLPSRMTVSADFEPTLIMEKSGISGIGE